MSASSFNPGSYESTPNAVLQQLPIPLLAERLQVVFGRAEDARRKPRFARLGYHQLRNEAARINKVMAERKIRLCKTCNGRGKHSQLVRAERAACDDCNGTKRIYGAVFTAKGLQNLERPCTKCNETGEQINRIFELVTCETCGGSGEAQP